MPSTKRRRGGDGGSGDDGGGGGSKKKGSSKTSTSTSSPSRSQKNKASNKKATAAATTNEANDNVDDTALPYFARLASVVQQMATNKVALQLQWQQLHDSVLSTYTGGNDDDGGGADVCLLGHVIVLATDACQQLLSQAMSSTAAAAAPRAVLSGLLPCVYSLLEFGLERALVSGSGHRHVVGQALMTLAIAGFQCLRDNRHDTAAYAWEQPALWWTLQRVLAAEPPPAILPPPSPDDDVTLTDAAVAVAAAAAAAAAASNNSALAAATLGDPADTTTDLSDAEGAQPAANALWYRWERHCQDIWQRSIADSNPAWLDACRVAEEQVKGNEAGRAVLELIVALTDDLDHGLIMMETVPATEASIPRPSKRSRRRPDFVAASAGTGESLPTNATALATMTAAQLDDLKQAMPRLAHYQHVLLDGRFTPKRWVAIGLSWHLNAVPCLLELANDILTPQSHRVLPSSDEWLGDNMRRLIVARQYLQWALLLQKGGGSRAPSGKLETLLMALVTAPIKAASSNQAAADVRDLGMVLTYNAIHCHAQSIEENHTNEAILISGHETEWLYPAMQDIIETVAAVTATSAVTTIATTAAVLENSTSDQRLWQDKMLFAASVYLLQLLPEAPLDVASLSFALSRIAATFARCSDGDGGDTDDNNARLTLLREKYNMDEELSAPTLSPVMRRAGKGRKTKKSDESTIDVCTLGGVFRSATLCHDECVTLLLRAMPAGSNVNGRTVLLSRLLDFVCISCAPQDGAASGGDIPADFSGQRKAVTKTPARKRAKVEKKTASSDSTKAQQGAADEREDSRRYAFVALDDRVRFTVADKPVALSIRTMAKSSAVLATNALDVIRKCMFSNAGNDSNASGKTISVIGTSVSADHVDALMRVGLALERKLGTPTNSATGSTEPSSSLSALKFYPHERKLWMSHCHLSLAFGACLATLGTQKSGQANPDGRMQPYKGLAAMHGMDTGRWPLAMPHSHRLFLLRSLQFGSDESSAFIVDRMLEAVKEIGDQPMSVAVRTHPLFWAHEDSDSFLVLKDAQIFLCAFLSLAADMQKIRLAKLLETAQTCMDNIAAYLSRSEGDQQTDATCFVSRLISLCGQAALASMFTKDFAPKIADIASAVLPDQLPMMRYLSINRSFFRTSTNFLGAFGAPEGPLPPNIVLSKRIRLDESSSSRLDALLYASFELGLQTATRNRCQLAHVSWSLIGLRLFWQKDTSLPASFDLKPCLAMMQLREEAAYINRQLRYFSSGPVSSVTKALDDARGRPQSSANSVKQTIAHAIQKATAFTSEILSRHDVRDGWNVSADTLVLLEMIPVFLGYCLTSLVRTPRDLFRHILLSQSNNEESRRRSSSIESDTGHAESDIESNHSDNAIPDAIDRLQDVCDKFGAVPAFPDWLDSSDAIFEGVAYDEAAKLAKEVLRAMSDIYNLCHQHGRRLCTRGLRTVLGSHKSKEDFTLRLFELYNQLSESLTLSPQEEDTFLEEIGSASSLGSTLFKALVQQGSAAIVTARSTLCGRTCHLIAGSLQQLAPLEHLSDFQSSELRACQEWEMLLTNCLATASIDFPDEIQAGVSAKSQQDIGNSFRWLQLHDSCADNVVSVTAFLRFTLEKRGRLLHPLKNVCIQVENFQIHQLGPASERVGDKGIIDSAFEDYFCEFAGKVIGCGKSRTAIACHIFLDPSSIDQFSSACLVRRLIPIVRQLIDWNLEDDSCGRFLDRLFCAIDDLRRHNRVDGSLLAWACGCDMFVGLVPFLSRAAPDATEAQLLRHFAQWNDVNFTFEEVLGSFMKFMLRDVEFTARGRLDEKVLTLLCDLSSMARPLKNEVAVVQGFDKACDMHKSSMYGRALSTAIASATHENGYTFVVGRITYLLAFIVSMRGQKCAIARTVFGSICENSNWRFLPNAFIREQLVHLAIICSLQIKRTEDFLTVLATSKYTAGGLSQSDAQNVFVACRFLFTKRTGQESLWPQRSSITSAGSTAGDTLKPTSAKCTYSAQDSFHVQHWYNCHTCGLVVDKGCCVPCARTCHAGHDIVYARESSFYCDCGAESNGDWSNCRCTRSEAKYPCSQLHRVDSNWCLDFSQLCVFATTFDLPLDALSLKAQFLQSGVVACLQASLQKWQSTPSILRYRTDLITWDAASVRAEFLARLARATGPRQACRLKTEVRSKFVSGRVFQSQTIRRPLSGNCMRSQVVGDCRGRLAAAELDGIMFFTLLDKESGQSQEHATFGEIGLLRKEKMLFPIDGIALDEWSQKHVVVWGKDQAVVIKSNNVWSKTSATYTLSMPAATRGELSIKTCSWLRTCAPLLLVAFDMAIHIYLMPQNPPACSATVTVPVSPLVCWKFTDGLSIEDVALFDWADELPGCFQVLLLQDSGDLVLAQLNLEASINQGTSSTSILPTYELDINAALRAGDEIAADKLTSLAKSGLIVIGNKHGGSASAIAHPGSGPSCCAFQLLPDSLEVDNNGDRRVYGPFGHWTEVCAVHLENATFFRVVCSAFEGDSRRQILLMIYFNESEVFAESLPLPELISDNRDDFICVDIVALSNPVVTTDGSVYDSDCGRTFREVLKICIFDQYGRVFTLTEKNGLSLDHCYTDYLVEAPAAPTEHPTIKFCDNFGPTFGFESLVNLTDDTALTFVSQLMNAERIHSLIRIDNDKYLTIPDPHGATFGVTLGNTPQWGVAAVRVFISSESRDAAPKALFVQGRRVDVIRGSARWYNVCLTCEEIATAMRLGVVHVGVSEAFDPSLYPRIDAMEIYGVPRERLDRWLPTMPREALIALTEPANAILKRNVRMSTVSLTSLLAGGRVRKSSALSALVRELFDAAAFDDDVFLEASKLSLYVEDDEHHRLQLSDYSRVTVCVQSLNASNWEDIPFVVGQKLLTTCFDKLASVARARPLNYVGALLACGGSIGTTLLSALKLTAPFLVNGKVDEQLTRSLVEICLLEMAMFDGVGAVHCPTTRAITLENVQSLLRIDIPLVVEYIGATLVSFCKIHNFKNRTQAAEMDVFLSQAFSERHQCDSCSKCPIETVRYSVPGEDHPFDLCRDCYVIASKDAKKVSLPGDRAVRVNGKQIGGKIKLLCSEVLQMQAISVDKGLDRRRHFFDEFMANLVSCALKIFSDPASSKKSVTQLATLLPILVGFAGEQQRVIAQTGRCVREIGDMLRRHISNLSSSTQRSVAAVLIESLCAMAPRRSYIDKGLSGTSPECTGHGAPSARKSLHHDPSASDRVVYVCSNDQRPCRFFQWESNAGDKSDLICSEIWQMLLSPPSLGAATLLSTLCTQVLTADLESLSGPADAIYKTTTFKDALSRDVADGVMCSRACLRSMEPGSDISWRFFQRQIYTANLGSSKSALLLLSLELLARVSMPIETSLELYATLCKFMASEAEETTAKCLARIALSRICGGDETAEEAVADFFYYDIEFGKILEHTQSLFAHLQLLRRKAHACGPNWKSATSDGILSVADIVSGHFMTPEDIIAKENSISAVLRGVLTRAKCRGLCWSFFCNTAIMERQASLHSLSNLHGMTAALYLLFLSSHTSDTGQAQALELASIAFSCSEGDILRIPQVLRKCVDASRNAESGRQLLHPSPSADDVFSLAKRFLVDGECSSVRAESLKLLSTLVQGMKKPTLAMLFERLLKIAFNYVENYGKILAELFDLLTRLVERFECRPDAVLVVSESVKCQLLASRYLRSSVNFFVVEDRKRQTRKRYNLSSCVHCNSKSARSADTSNSSGQEPAAKSGVSSIRWHHIQASPFTKFRLNTSRDSCKSDAFHYYYPLKYRLAIAEIHVEVADPRSRFVKTMSVSCSPKPVTDVHLGLAAQNWAHCATIILPRGATRASRTLQAPVLAAVLRIEFVDFYERPGESKASEEGALVIHCPRCARIVTNAHGVCASCGEVAFQCRKCRHINYDRLDAFLCSECGYCPSGSFSFEVTAGVASNAIAISNGEEYDRAVKMFEVASSLEDDLKRLLRNRLSLLASSRGSGKIRDLGLLELNRAFDLYDDSDFHSSLDSIDKIGKEGSVIKLVARGGASSSHHGSLLWRLFRPETDNDRATTTTNSSSRAASDLLIRHLGQDLQLDDDLDLAGFAAALEGSSSLSRILASTTMAESGNNRAPSAVRLGERKAEETGDGGQEPDSNDAANKRKTRESKELQLCDRLYVLLKEAQREQHLLSQRIAGWDRLERDALAETGAEYDDGKIDAFRPCQCPNCAGAVTVHLLSLWRHMFVSNPSTPVSADFVQCLLQEDVSSNNARALPEWKRAVVYSVAMFGHRSSATTVLDVLRQRVAANGYDATSADILGKIVEHAKPGNAMHAQFVQLAMDAMQQHGASFG